MLNFRENIFCGYFVWTKISPLNEKTSFSNWASALKRDIQGVVQKEGNSC